MDFLKKIGRKIQSGIYWLVDQFEDFCVEYEDVFIIGLVVLFLLVLITALIEFYWFKLGFSAAAGWYLSKGVILPFSASLNRYVIQKKTEWKNQYYCWKEKR